MPKLLINFKSMRRRTAIIVSVPEMDRLDVPVLSNINRFCTARKKDVPLGADFER